MKTLKDKLYHQEAPPPPNVWAKIDAALTEKEDLGRLKNKFEKEATTPPPFVWEQIAQQLPPVKTGKVVRFNWVRYAAAAVAIFGVVYFGLKLTNNSPLIPESAQTPSITVTPEQNTITEKPVQSAADSEKPKEIAVTENKIKRNSSFTQKSNKQLAYHKVSRTNNEERYVTITNDEGKLLRVSKKLDKYTHCISNPKDHMCKDQLQEWQSQLACVALSTSSGNFLDLLSLVDKLSERDL